MNTSKTTLLVIILHDADRLPALLKAWRKIGVPGSTILPSAGSYMAEHWGKRSGLLSIFDQKILQQRTLLSLIDDPEILEQAIAEAERMVKGFDSPHSGILFTVPIGEALGLQKWGQTSKAGESTIAMSTEDEATSRILQWLEEDIRARYGDLTHIDWSQQRNTPVSEIMQILDIHPTIVRVDTPLLDVFSQLRANPGMPAACVVNKEGRLVGVIPLKGLADVMMAPVMPEAYVNDPAGYEKALEFANIDQQHIAAAIMSDPVFVIKDETLETAYQRMKTHNLSGVPVVDKLYRVKGFITLLGLMSVCFSDPELFQSSDKAPG